MQRSYLTCCLVLLVGLASGCGPGKPSEADGRRVVEGRINRSGSGLIELVGFAKTNATEMEAFGMRGYQMEYRAEIAFRSDALWGGEFSARRFEARPNNPLYYDPFRGEEVRSGQRKTVTGTLEFELTERGWKGPDGQVY